MIKTKKAYKKIGAEKFRWIYYNRNPIQFILWTIITVFSILCGIGFILAPIIMYVK